MSELERLAEVYAQGSHEQLVMALLKAEILRSAKDQEIGALRAELEWERRTRR